MKTLLSGLDKEEVAERKKEDEDEEKKTKKKKNIKKCLRALNIISLIRSTHFYDYIVTFSN